MKTATTTSEKGIDLIKGFESLHDGDLSAIGLQPKMCPAGIWTIGYGHALKDSQGNWLKGKDGYRKLLELFPDLETITEPEAEDWLEMDLASVEKNIHRLPLELNQNQFDALVSFVFNCGFGAFVGSTLYRRIVSGKGDIREAFLMWKKCNGKVLPGLVRRRNVEANLFLS